MKKIYLFLMACSIALAPALMQAQTTTHDEKDDIKRVVIVKKSVDENGEVVIEKVIGEGSKAEVVLKEMALHEGDQDVSITIIKNSDDDGVDGDAERLFMFRSADGEKVEGHIESADHQIKIISKDLMEVKESVNEDGHTEMIFIRKAGDSEPTIIEIEGDGEMPAHVREKLDQIESRMHKANGDFERFAFVWHGDDFSESSGKANCAALGVYVNSDGQSSKGLRINDLIGGGGAEESGLQSHDRIVAIDDQYVTSYRELLDALSQYVPGEDVNVTYQREGQKANVVVTLKSWKEMPTMANTWRANVTCDEKEDDLLEVEEVPEVKKVAPVNTMPVIDNQLELESFNVFPNPSEGKFRVQFFTDSEPLSVRVTDLTGKVIYKDNLKNFDGIFNDQINLKKHGPGSYILTVEQNDRVFAEQIIVQ